MEKKTKFTMCGFTQQKERVTERIVVSIGMDREENGVTPFCGKKGLRGSSLLTSSEHRHCGPAFRAWSGDEQLF